ncbi:MAG: hypothetical protein ACM3SR_16745 [Ignavibacteriales bacterium]
MKQRRVLRDWLGLHKREEKEKRIKKQWREAFLWQRFVLITRMERKALEFEALDRGKRHFLSMERQLERTFLLTLECIL